MANVDAPRGFTPIKMLNGSPWMGQVRTIVPTDGTDVFIGDMITLTSNAGAVTATNDANILGVVVGVGKNNGLTGETATAFNPDDLTTLYYDDSASTHTDFVLYYVPVDDMIFEVQTAADLDLSAGDACDIIATHSGSTVTGRSGQEITSSTNADFVVVEIPQIVGDDPTLANANVYITVTGAEQAFK